MADKEWNIEKIPTLELSEDMKRIIKEGEEAYERLKYALMIPKELLISHPNGKNQKP